MKCINTFVDTLRELDVYILILMAFAIILIAMIGLAVNSVESEYEAHEYVIILEDKSIDRAYGRVCAYRDGKCAYNNKSGFKCIVYNVKKIERIK